jgi:hypothetical protein
LENKKKVATNSPRIIFKRNNKVKEGGASSLGVKKEHERTYVKVQKMMRGKMEPSTMPTMVQTTK